MKVLRSLLLASGLLLLPVTAFAAPDAAQTAAICGQRTSCKIEKTHDAGKSPEGAALSVVEIRLGLADKPKDQDEGCINGNARDGGLEYWLLDGTAAPKQVLQLCNDGYGMSGVGEDEVEVGPNRLIASPVWRLVLALVDGRHLLARAVPRRDRAGLQLP